MDTFFNRWWPENTNKYIFPLSCSYYNLLSVENEVFYRKPNSMRLMREFDFGFVENKK